MNLICRREKLLDAIQTTSKAAAGRSTLPILECLLLQAGDSGIHMIGNDLQIGIKYSGIEGEIIEDGAVALEARMFFDIIRKLPEGDVFIKTDTNQITVIKSGKSEFKILGLPGDEFPVLQEMPEGTETPVLVLSAAVLRDMLKKTLFSVAAEDSSKQTFTGELFEIENGILNLVASDTFRIAHAYSTALEQTGSLNLLIPGKALNEILKILPDEEETQVSVYATDLQILFSFGSCVVVSRLINGDYLKYRNSFNMQATTEVKASRDLLVMCLERASLISTKETKKYPIRIAISQDMLTITTNTEVGASYEELAVVTDGSPMELAFNPKFLLDALKAMEDDEISLCFATPSSPVIIKGEPDACYRYLVLPLRIKND